MYIYTYTFNFCVSGISSVRPFYYVIIERINSVLKNVHCFDKSDIYKKDIYEVGWVKLSLRYKKG